MHGSSASMAQGECRRVARLDTHPSYDEGHLHGTTWELSYHSHKKATAGQQNNRSSHQPFPISLLHLKDLESQQTAASQKIWDGRPENFGR